MFNEKINEIQIVLSTVALNQAVSLEIVMTASNQKKERKKKRCFIWYDNRPFHTFT